VRGARDCAGAAAAHSMKTGSSAVSSSVFLPACILPGSRWCCTRRATHCMDRGLGQWSRRRAERLRASSAWRRRFQAGAGRQAVTALFSSSCASFCPRAAARVTQMSPSRSSREMPSPRTARPRPAGTQPPDCRARRAPAAAPRQRRIPGDARRPAQIHSAEHPLGVGQAALGGGLEQPLEADAGVFRRRNRAFDDLREKVTRPGCTGLNRALASPRRPAHWPARASSADLCNACSE